MTNLFSVFDPQVLKISINWVSSITALMLFPSMFWLVPSQALMSVKVMAIVIHREFKDILGSLCAPGNTLLSLSLFMFIFLNNMQGMGPYIFTSSSHLPFAFAMALPLWVGHMVYSWFIQPSSMLAHLVPLSTPVGLMPFMVMIELTSAIIRPLTLSVRLVANIVAGHLLLVLISSGAHSVALLGLIVIIVALMMLAVLELAVALIQAYVFSILSTLYLSEVNSKTLIS